LSDLSEKHRVRRRTLLQHSSLLELLELPSLMDACVRSNLYEEALSIASFANTLERRHTEKNTVVLRVISQIRSRQSDLRRHLLYRLKQGVTMPQCLEAVTALRRLNGIDLEGQQGDDLHDAAELKLQVDFLEARDAWLDSTPRAASSIAVSEQLLDAIERYRTRYVMKMKLQLIFYHYLNISFHYVESLKLPLNTMQYSELLVVRKNRPQRLRCSPCG
jgi:conserved oligomeric Golgi complex subunit 8